MKFEISTECDWLSFSKTSDEIALCKRITLYINRKKFKGRQSGSFTVRGADFPARATILVEAENREDIPENVFIESDGYICMKAVNYQEKCDTPDGGFRRLEPCTREGSAPRDHRFYEARREAVCRLPL